MPSTDFAVWHCRTCGGRNETEVDFSAGLHQEFAEECDRCDSPNSLHIFIDPQTQQVMAEARPEDR